MDHFRALLLVVLYLVWIRQLLVYVLLRRSIHQQVILLAEVVHGNPVAHVHVVVCATFLLLSVLRLVAT